ncbi:PLP-dependent transferase [Jaminaea rosea]|uniref:PLP-dependent transferase n=1 Tax=Jaminaea rosea TaxID=1569628 RepID=A0A316UQS3_9BASI|nr:PLP-dependent transferase [Jaminaea rosea]PWN26661.1 PLP-dependent transferase [Jaminaea rosea]
MPGNEQRRVKLSHRARTRPAAGIRTLFPKEKVPGMISLLAGKPNEKSFPFKALTIDTQGADGEDVKLKVDGEELAEALNYGLTPGITGLVQWLMEFQARAHNRPIGPDWRLNLGAGSQDLIIKTFEAMMDRGDVILAEDPVYAGVLPALESQGCRVVPVPTNRDGIIVSQLQHILENWESAPMTKDLPRPKCLYTSPTGGNPSGTTQTEAVKEGVLREAIKHDFTILEDDPYYYLEYPTAGAPASSAVDRPRPRSYWSMDYEWGNGHVVRFESFSKLIGAGLRVGFAMGPAYILDAVDAHTANTNLQPSGLSQVVIYSLLRNWGSEGFYKHVDRTAAMYREKAVRFEECARRILCKPGLARFETPTAGMFLWLELNLPESKADTMAFISEKAVPAGVLAVPGFVFLPLPQRTKYVRVSFSKLADEDFEEACMRLKRAVEACWEEVGESVPEVGV